MLERNECSIVNLFAFLFFTRTYTRHTLVETRLLDWSRTGYLTAGIESSVHLWSGRTQSVKYTIAAVADEPNDSAKTIVSCLKWDGPGEKLAYSFTTDDGSPSSTLSLSSSSSLFIMSFDSPTTVTAADRPLYASSAGGLSGNGRSLSADTSSSNKRTGKNVPNNYIKVTSALLLLLLLFVLVHYVLKTREYIDFYFLRRLGPRLISSPSYFQ